MEVGPYTHIEALSQARPWAGPLAWPLARPWARPKAGPVIRPEHAYRGRPPRKSTFYEKRYFRPSLVISEPSRPQKWIRLEILR